MNILFCNIWNHKYISFTQYLSEKNKASNSWQTYETNTDHNKRTREQWRAKCLRLWSTDHPICFGQSNALLFHSSDPFINNPLILTENSALITSATHFSRCSQSHYCIHKSFSVRFWAQNYLKRDAECVLYVWCEPSRGTNGLTVSNTGPNKWLSVPHKMSL